MSATPSVKSGPSAREVREWGNANGFESKPGTRGRLSPALVEAYNAKHKGANAYKEGTYVPTVTVHAKPAKGRAVERKVNIAQARAALAAKGVTVGKRGRLPKDALSAYVLGTL